MLCTPSWLQCFQPLHWNLYLCLLYYNSYCLYLMLLLIDMLFSGVLFYLEEYLSSLITFPCIHYFPWANMDTLVSISLWLRTSPPMWMLNLTQILSLLSVLRIICRCLKQIVYWNWIYWCYIHGNISSVSPVNHFVYNCNDLLCLCPFYLDFCVWIWNQPRNWKYHGKRAGKLLKVKEANRTMNIPSTVCWWTFVNSYLLTNSRRLLNLARLVPFKSDAKAYNL